MSFKKLVKKHGYIVPDMLAAAGDFLHDIADRLYDQLDYLSLYSESLNPQDVESTFSEWSNRSDSYPESELQNSRVKDDFLSTFHQKLGEPTEGSEEELYNLYNSVINNKVI